MVTFWYIEKPKITDEITYEKPPFRAAFSVPINLSARWQMTKKEGIFSQNKFVGVQGEFVLRKSKQ